MTEQIDEIANLITNRVLDEVKVGRFYKFIMPNVVLVGEGATIKLGSEVQKLKTKHALIVTDRGITKLGLHGTTVNSLKQAGIEVEIFDAVKPDPDTEVVAEGISFAKGKGIDIVVGLGGGSPLDVAKAIAFLLTNPGSIHDYEGIDLIHNHRLPLVAIATTSGTGSEVTSNAVITDPKRNKKMIISSSALVPDIAVVDPRLTRGIPPKVTAATGIDVLVHAIEAFISKNSITISSALAHRSIMMVTENLPLAVGNGEDMDARHRMAIASLMAGMAFSNVGLGACHATAHQLGTTYKIPHGVANGIMLPAVMTFNSLVCRDRLREVASAMGEPVEGLTDREASLKAIAAVKTLIQEVGLPSSIREVGGSEADFPQMAQYALQDPTLLSNPRQAGLEDLIAIYRLAF
jgi:alcohol dehydrogenase